MRKRLIYCYVSNGAAAPDVSVTLPPRDHITRDPFASLFTQEGHYLLFTRLLERKIFDEILVIIESARHPGYLTLAPNMRMVVIPHLSLLNKITQPTDILWVRGGWRSWYAVLEKWHQDNRWLVFYRANSNRGAWTFWNIVLDDLRDTCELDAHERFYFPVLKPINEYLFMEKRLAFPKYDLMIGASHIHDKKQQFKIIDILKAYKARYNQSLHCVMPGALRGGQSTQRMMTQLRDVSIDIPGMLPRPALAELYNQTRLYLHFASCGQNDRGPLEALACGTPIMLAHPQLHEPAIRPDAFPFSYDINPDDPDQAAQQIHALLSCLTLDVCRQVAISYRERCGLETALPRYEFLFQQILATPYTKRLDLYSTLQEYHAHEKSHHHKTRS